MGIETIAWGALGGAAVGLVGYSKAARKGETFNVQKFSRALVLGAAVGGYAAYTGQELDIVSASVAGATVTAFVDQFLSAVWAHVKPVKKK